MLEVTCCSADIADAVLPAPDVKEELCDAFVCVYHCSAPEVKRVSGVAFKLHKK